MRYIYGSLSWLNEISTFVFYLMPKPFLQKSSSDTIQPIAEECTREFITFPMGISPKVNVIGTSEFELANFQTAVQDFSHYATKIGDRPQWQAVAEWNK